MLPIKRYFEFKSINYRQELTLFQRNEKVATHQTKGTAVIATTALTETYPWVSCATKDLQSAVAHVLHRTPQLFSCPLPHQFHIVAVGRRELLLHTSVCQAFCLVRFNKGIGCKVASPTDPWINLYFGDLFKVEGLQKRIRKDTVTSVV